MREKILQSIESRILHGFPSGSAYSRLEISESEIPRSIKYFLLSALQRRSELEASELLNVRSEWFNSDNLEYQKVLRQAVMTLGKASCFPASEWPKAVHQAVEFVVDYLVSPVDLLTRFVFPGDSDSISATDLQRKTGYFVDYAYLAHGVDAFIERKNSQRIFKNDFFNALTHLDHQYNANNDAEKWIKLLRPLTEVVGLPSPGIPVPMVIRFFKDKGLPAIGLEIDKAARARQAEIISPATLLALLATEEPAVQQKGAALQQKQPQEQLQTSQNAPPEQAPQASQQPAPQQPAPQQPNPHKQAPKLAPPKAHTPEPLTGQKSQQDTPEAVHPPDSPLPLWKKFQKAESVPPAAEQEQAAEPLWKTFSRPKEEASVLDKLHVEAALPPTVLGPDPVAIVLGSASKKSSSYVKKLFQGNQEAFDQTMKALASAPDWTSASQIIAQRVFRPFKVDIYSADAVDFTNAVESRYSGLQS